MEQSIFKAWVAPVSALLTASLVIGGVALAQEETVTEGETEVITEPVEEPPVDDSPVDIVPDSEKSTQASAYISNMKSTLRRVLQFLEEAREERDVVKLNCINEKLTAVKGLLRVSEASDLTLQEALARRDSDSADHEYEKIAIAARKIERLRAESEACVGELAVYSGETSVEVLVTGEPPAPADPASSPIPVDVVVRPPAASPSQ
ncbi:MAG: hypothetical protein AAFU77_00145 [Myxococcota bacterium]